MTRYLTDAEFADMTADFLADRNWVGVARWVELRDCSHDSTVSVATHGDPTAAICTDCGAAL